MSTIRCIYTQEPNFPATDQHPDAQRYIIGGLWVDAIGGEPTQTEVDAVLNPQPSPNTDGMIERQQDKIRQQLSDAIDRLPADQREPFLLLLELNYGGR